MRELEDSYWWFVSRRRLALSWLNEAAPAGRVLDIGCGTGALLRELQGERDAHGLDFSPIALSLGRNRGLRCLVEGDAQDLPFPDSSFQAIVSLDTLEHVPDDKLALSEMARVLAPGGALILNVPAFQWLWGPHDVALHHFRRYTYRELRQKVEAAGFEVERLSYGVFFLFPVVGFFRLRDRMRKGGAEVRLPQVGPGVNRALIRLMELEAKLMKRIPLPWGSSLTLLARRR